MPHYYIGGTGTSGYITSSTNTTASTSVISNWIVSTSPATSTTCTTWFIDSSTYTRSTHEWQPVPLTAEQETELALLRARVAAEEQLRQAERRRAQRRARATLLRFITPEQRAQFQRHGHFTVRGGATGSTYRINRGRVANIDVLCEQGRVLRRLCAHPDLDVPDCDTMLAQALHLQSPANEEQFVRTANVRHVQ